MDEIDQDLFNPAQYDDPALVCCPVKADLTISLGLWLGIQRTIESG